MKFLQAILLLAGVFACCQTATGQSNVQIGAYYYDGWGGKNAKAGNPDEPWAINAPRQLTRRMLEEFPDREPLWGWRHDSQEIMEKQIDLAADSGIDFFLFCWYWRDTKGPINPDAIDKLPGHESLKRYLKARNKHRIRFGLLIANHQGAEITGPENWKQATAHWMSYFKDPQYVTVDSKPLVVIFNSQGIDNHEIDVMQQVAQQKGLTGLSIAGCSNRAEAKNFTIKTHYNVIPGYSAGSEEHTYKELTDAQAAQWKGSSRQPYIPTVIAGWDKRPWEDPTGKSPGGAKPGHFYSKRTPAQFKSHLNDAINWLNSHPDQTVPERMVLIYAWNELGEGGYLVPTKGDPKGRYLKMVKEVKAKGP